MGPNSLVLEREFARRLKSSVKKICLFICVCKSKTFVNCRRGGDRVQNQGIEKTVEVDFE